MTEKIGLCQLVFHTVQILQRAKSAFRFKDLAGLRKNLEVVLQETTETLKNT
jgi:hypothetical protein